MTTCLLKRAMPLERLATSLVRAASQEVNLLLVPSEQAATQVASVAAHSSICLQSA